MRCSFRYLYPVLCAIMMSVSLGCNSGGGTEIGTGIMVGTLYQDGGQPAAYASMRFIRSDQVDSIVLTKKEVQEYYVNTTSNGDIILQDSLADGYYQAFGGSGTLVSFHDSILFIDGICKEPISDTLRLPGSCFGRVLLDSSRSSKSILILVSGSFIRPDADGSFYLEDLAQGTYQIRFLSTKDFYDIYDTSIFITSGVTDTIREPVIIPYEAPVKGLTYNIDTLHRSVTFSWNRSTYNKIGSYRIELFVNNLPSPYIKVVNSLTPAMNLGTQYSDTQYTHYLQDSVKFRIRVMDRDNDPAGPYSQRISLAAYNLCPIRQLTTPADSMYATDICLHNEQLSLVCTSRFNAFIHGIRQYDTAGIFLQDLLFKDRNAAQPDNATDTIPLALSFSGDTICILSRQPDHNIFLRKFLNGNEVSTIEDIAIAVDNDITPQIKSTPEGDFYISANMTLHRLSHDGLVLLSKKRIAEPFAATSNGIYVIPTYAPYEVILMNKLFEQTNSITYVQDTSFIASDASVTICAFTANNNGYCCSLIDKSLFIFNINTINIARLYLNRGNSVADIELSPNNILYILYNDTRIESIDLSTLKKWTENR